MNEKSESVLPRVLDPPNRKRVAKISKMERNKLFDIEKDQIVFNKLSMQQQAASSSLVGVDLSHPF